MFDVATIYLWKHVLHPSSTLEKENRRWKDVFHRPTAGHAHICLI
jgi:hypothetical protein